MSALALDPTVILAEAARLRELAVKDKTYRATPIGHLAGRYLDELAFDNYSPKTVEERERTLAYLALDYAHLTPAEIEAAHLREFLNQWATNAPNYRRHLVSTVRVFFEWAHENDHVPFNPARAIRTPRTKREDSPRRAFPRDTVRDLVLAQPQRRDQLAIELLYWGALRRAELRQVRVDDLDFYSRLLTVHGKGGTVLEQSLPQRFARDLELYLIEAEAKPDWFLLSPQKRLRRGAWPDYTYELVTHDPRQPYSLAGITRWWQNCRSRAGVEMEMHEMRHTAGTHFHQEGHDLVATQHYMRHASPATTAGTYVHLDRTRAISEVQARMVDPLEDV